MTRLVLSEGGTTASEPIEVNGCVAGVVDVVVFGFSSLDSIEVNLQVGSDGENWGPAFVGVFTRGGFSRIRFRGIAARYVRVYYRALGSSGGSGLGILTTTLHGTRQGPRIGH